MRHDINNLKHAFNDCKRVDTSACINKTSFEIISDGTFFIYDDKNEQPISITNGDRYQLIVRNQKRQDICVVKSDKCLFTDEHKKCDCLLFNTKQFFLVEIKDGINRGGLRNTAVLQLKATIDILLESNIDLSKYETKAIICFKNGRTRPLQASFNTQREMFFESYKISLEEGNEVIFD